ncbi:MAG TPA: glutaredoxin 3 [Xanthobacteraceae bacterium]|jgi:glutaredoxin 3|nr:glutaredoxin 3 [Xanthobacteraceae bacterium]
MPDIVIYTKDLCPYCDAAKDLLRRKDVAFTEINITGNQERRAEMIERALGRDTAPQIFIDTKHIGGCDDLYALDEAGGLDPMLTA